MNTKHIKVGDMYYFKSIVDTVVQNKVSKWEPATVAGFYGLPLIEDTRIPKDRAVLMNAKGEVLQIFKI